MNNLFIKDITFKGCGCTLQNIRAYNDQHLWSSMILSYCTNVLITNVLLYDPVGFGISGFNVKGNSTIENTTIIMKRQNLLNHVLFTCSYGVNWKYEDGLNINKEDSYLQIHSIILKQNYSSSTGICPSKESIIIQILLHQCCHDVYVIIRDARFHKLKGKILSFDVSSLSNNSIYFYNCSFYTNTVLHAVDVQYATPPSFTKMLYPKLRVTLVKVKFLYTHALENNYNNSESILLIALKSNFNRFVELIVVLSSTEFKDNFLMLMKVSSSIPPVNDHHFSVFVTVSEHCNIESNHYSKPRLHHLISLNNAKMYFNGIIRFYDNIATAIIYASSSMLSFSNSSVFINNRCDELFHLNCELCYLELIDKTTIAVSHNSLNNQVIQSSIKYNNPYPYCLFQYFTTSTSKYKDFRIQIMMFETELRKPMFEILRLTSHCRWVTGAAFQNIKPLEVNRAIIRYNDTLHPLGTHLTVCHCPTSTSYYNCSIDELGPVYPGENLTVDLCLPHNHEETGVMYAETYNNNLPESACKVAHYDSMKHVFKGKESKRVEFAIATELPTGSHSTAKLVYRI